MTDLSSVSARLPVSVPSALTPESRSGSADQYQARAAPARSWLVPDRRYASSAERTRRYPKAFRAGSTNWLATLRFWVMAAAVVLTVVTGLDYVRQAIVLRRQGIAERAAASEETEA